MAKAPVMQRSRGQIATAYAPHSLFTFEGGRGACMALPTKRNPRVDLSIVTMRTIGEMIQEYFATWYDRAKRGDNLAHAVPPELAVDKHALMDDEVRVNLGSFEFQIPDQAEYRPFPLAFVCGRCKLYRNSRDPNALDREGEGFKSACPSGPRNCADDWEQLDVVLTHWSGEIEPVSPEYRHWNSDRQEIHSIKTCDNCGENRFFLQRPPGPLGGWYFECVNCRQPRQILQRDSTSLKILGPLIDAKQATWAEINMEPVSYRASAAYYVHGDRLLVFENDKHLALLNDPQTGDLERLVSSQYGYPVATLADSEREQILREAGRSVEWDEYRRLQQILKAMEGTPGFTADLIATQKNQLTKLEKDWAASVFKAHAQAPSGIRRACQSRRDYVRKHDPLRMVVEHLTLQEEKLHGGRMADGKQVSVDVVQLDPFLWPDGLSESDLLQQRAATTKKLKGLGIAEMRLLRGVGICEYSFAYTRTAATPFVTREKAGEGEMPVRLRLFDKVEVSDGAKHPILCSVQKNEGFYVKLDEELVREWLDRNCIPLPSAAPGVKLGGQLIENFDSLQQDRATRFSRFLDEYRREGALPRQAYPFVYTLLHTMSHHLIDTCSSMSGLDLGSFGEHLFVPDLAFLVYRRGTTMDLGNLSSMWRDQGDPDIGNHVLEHMLNPSSLRCGSESVCNHRGGACPDCVLIPENACVTRNELLSRSVLVGRGKPRFDNSVGPLMGYLDLAAARP